MNNATKDTTYLLVLMGGWLAGVIVGAIGLLGFLMYLAANENPAAQEQYSDHYSGGYSVHECLDGAKALAALGDSKWQVVSITRLDDAIRLSVMTDLEGLGESRIEDGLPLPIVSHCIRAPVGFSMPKKVRSVGGRIVAAD